VGTPADKGSVTGTDAVGIDGVSVSAWAIDHGDDWVVSSRGQGNLDGVAGPNREWTRFGGKVGGPAASRGLPVWAPGLGPGCSNSSSGDRACSTSTVGLTVAEIRPGPAGMTETGLSQVGVANLGLVHYGGCNKRRLSECRSSSCQVGSHGLRGLGFNRQRTGSFGWFCWVR